MSLEDAPTCPACGYQEPDAWEIDFGPGIDGEADIECGRCGTEYHCECSCTFLYRSHPIAPKPEDKS